MLKLILRLSVLALIPICFRMILDLSSAIFFPLCLFFYTLLITPWAVTLHGSSCPGMLTQMPTLSWQAVLLQYQQGEGLWSFDLSELEVAWPQVMESCVSMLSIHNIAV